MEITGQNMEWKKQQWKCISPEEMQGLLWYINITKYKHYKQYCTNTGQNP